MRLTGGVKLTYGCIPGLTKAQLHVRAQRREDFADMLLDLHLAVRPRFTIIDAIVAMEGQGPGSGTPRDLDSLFAARDAVALDAALADRAALERRPSAPSPPPSAAASSTSTSPTAWPATPSRPRPAFVPAAATRRRLLPPPLHRFARNLVTARPRLVDADACTRCRDCATICGAPAIAMEPLPVFDDTRCVRCYACTEVCPTAAIDNVAPRAGPPLRAAADDPAADRRLRPRPPLAPATGAAGARSSTLVSPPLDQLERALVRSP